MSLISDKTLEDIADRINLIDVVSEYVELKKSGQGFVGLCPFHKEKTPSFSVNPLRQMYHCFGCHKGGNVFRFLMDVEGYRFPQAVEKLAKRAGIEIEQPTTTHISKPKPSLSQKKLLDAITWTAKYYHYLLTEKSEYKFALDYLHERGVSDATIKVFNIGVSPRGWSNLIEKLTHRGYKTPELIEAGLVVPRKESQTDGYDRFRERLMFPITNSEGQVVGFGGRALKPDDNPKYLNSSESALFPKRKILYGLHENQRGIRLKQEVLVVEGFMDVVGLYEKGVDNAVATMGTALTEYHCSELKRLTRNVITIFDPDAAGRDAWKRSVSILMEAGMFAKDLTLPEQKDPDEFVVSEGKDKFYELCAKAPRHVTKVLKNIAAKGSLSEQESAKVLEDLKPLLIASRRLPDRALLWDNVSLVTGVSQAGLKALIEDNPHYKKPATPQPRQQQRPIQRKAIAEKKPRAHELEFLQLSLRFPTLFLALTRSQWESSISDELCKLWLTKLADVDSVEQFDETLQTLLTADTAGWLQDAASARLMQTTPEPSKNEGDLFEALTARLQVIKKEQEIHNLTKQIRLSQRLADDQEQMRLLERLRELRSE